MQFKIHDTDLGKKQTTYCCVSDQCQHHLIASTDSILHSNVAFLQHLQSRNLCDIIRGAVVDTRQNFAKRILDPPQHTDIARERCGDKFVPEEQDLNSLPMREVVANRHGILRPLDAEEAVDDVVAKLRVLCGRIEEVVLRVIVAYGQVHVNARKARDSHAGTRASSSRDSLACLRKVLSFSRFSAVTLSRAKFCSSSMAAWKLIKKLF
ncbi:hypothetical protein CkaCkLH20_11182 [Colletotrichum karsti]|uniref:Uncharacterized protein n=1 Tax=Colletotrichum karsti TaxID=1095194 RepID=A0A9P6LFK3_9PEZI|nr:uncharacterized protein CkaCkLH20_11182 [Colletotrichum karsti]KAF9871261.1 hypothetical protein CkaCkLH20_11182 [Colletotrichum karsti]